VAELATIQAHYAAWLDALPPSLQDGATAEALQAICELDLSELQAVELSLGMQSDVLSAVFDRGI
ncbi:MAG TPA: hypothetical protein VN814_03020, partial [Caulobacteraceae bacterium]|nr:hypothetical protein [Caulobacteraceae bacterium]